MVSKNQQDWDQKVPLFLLAYRSAVHETTGYSPSQMLFGRDLRLPCDLLFGRPPDTPSSPEEYVQNLQARFEDVHNLARERINLRTEKMKTRYDTKATGHQFKEGDKVWFYNPTRRKGLSPKLQSHWDGPYTILKIINDVVIRIPDEAWLYYYDPTIKQQSNEWKHPSSPTPKKAKTVKSAGKVMTTIFFIINNCVSTRYRTYDSYYTNVPRTMIQHIKRKCPLPRNGFLLYHDNARPHFACCVLDVSQQNNVDILPHPPYSPDKAPCDFWLFLNLRNHSEANVLPRKYS
ncbi:retrovirus-related Pol polyprotein from transposon 412 [Trichonephila clavipes]|uniref:Retrovirus-related Pol polyprotein from transposon 412 n=1 Tax=Trichonephila clavipes TaxID=2585209 RepID=A0A8X6W4D9_TRICX|nr:retrovirus-related Pol polyprotein from transposon 412 [Trichonephila clavipes]